MSQYGTSDVDVVVVVLDVTLVLLVLLDVVVLDDTLVTPARQSMMKPTDKNDIESHSRPRRNGDLNEEQLHHEHLPGPGKEPARGHWAKQAVPQELRAGIVTRREPTEAGT